MLTCSDRDLVALKKVRILVWCIPLSASIDGVGVLVLDPLAFEAFGLGVFGLQMTGLRSIIYNYTNSLINLSSYVFRPFLASCCRILVTCGLTVMGMG